MSAVNKREFTVEDVVLEVKRPNHIVQQQAQFVYGRTYREACDAGVPVNLSIEKVMREQKLWDEDREAERVRLVKALSTGKRKLDAGGIRKSEAKEIAIQMRRDRNELQDLLSKRNELERNTAEAIAENAKFNYLVSQCTLVKETGKKYFESHEAYLEDYERSDFGPTAAFEMGRLLYDFDEDVIKGLPENKFLEDHGFSNADGHLINKDGHLVNAKGQLVNDDGQLVNEKDEPIDDEGNLLKVEFVPFLDDDESV